MKKKITVEGFFDSVRKYITKSLDDKLAKKVNSILDDPSPKAKRSKKDVLKLAKLLKDLEKIGY
jgi:hypothetical protein